MTDSTNFGLLLPHFSEYCTRDRIHKAGTNAEAFGFDSVWVRDHVFVPPEHREHGGIEESTFTEPLLTLATLSSVTDSLTFGTAILTPLRHPLQLSQNLGTLSYLSNGDLIAGMGIGRWKQEFEALNVPYNKRSQLIKENFEILQRTFNGTDVDFEGELFEFENVSINPRPQSHTPLWYGGFSKIAMRRAVNIADGILPGRCPINEFKAKMDYLSDLEDEHDRDLSVGLVPPISVGRSTEEAEAKLDIPALIEGADSYMAGDYKTKEDIRGYYVAGTPGECAAQLQEFVDCGVDHLVLDMRHAFDELEEMMALISDEVIPSME